MQRRGRYVIGKELKGYRYQDIAHGAGSIIWFQDEKDNVHEQVSKGGIGDFHYKIMDGKEDDLWRGRSTKPKKGVVTVIPPVKDYAKGVIDLPDSLFNSLNKRFKPEVILIETPGGVLKRVALKKKKVNLEE